MSQTETDRHCESGCGCRYDTNDPDRFDCACDGPCTMASDEVWYAGCPVEAHGDEDAS
jgi:hypothetical protein